KRGIEGIEGRGDHVPIDDGARTHTAKLSGTTDKNRQSGTTETTVTQEISIYDFNIRNLAARGARRDAGLVPRDARREV
ncbi:hypothetical protein, partial [Mycobacterium sp.]|uniref:hypothetical protein n=1 Tax=Mycobacterium sp. TaxID=1785 RepID=UPI00260F676A